jgi:hypothetical protein
MVHKGRRSATAEPERYGYLLCIPSFEIGSEPVISFFNKGKSISQGLPFLQFCKK